MDGRDGAVLKIGDDYEIRFERRLKHAPEKVWAAITGPGAMTKWFDETHMPDPLEIGASIRFVHSHVGMESRGEITALDPPRLIEWTWIGGFGPAARMSFEVLPNGDGSRLILRQQVADPPVTARTLAGWHKCLDRLQATLDGGDEPRDMAPWLKLFEETYKPKVLAAGITVPQSGAPTGTS
jgi:uncharacterized protein YndB with AHSA1/START domain